MTLLEQAKAFRNAFGQEILDNISRFGFIKSSLWNMQKRLIIEEANEFLQSADELMEDPENNQKREELLKELCDVVFVCYQFAATYNMDLDTAMTRVYQSNMSKLDDNGMPIYREDGKVLKGPNYQPPSLDHLFPQSNTLYDTNGK